MFLLFAQSGFSSDYKLTDLLSSAAATVGVIIFGTIFLQFLSGKYMELTSRFRALAGEYRNGGAGEVRHHSLQEQMTLYRRRLHLMRWASLLAAGALLCFLAAILAGGFSMLFPPVVAIKYLGTIGLFVGLVQIAMAVSLEIAELVLARHELPYEVGDLDEPVKQSGW